MPLFRHCQNCYGPKNPDRYVEYLCEACEKVALEAQEYAVRENQDPGTARRNALLSRAPGAMSGKTPSGYFDRVSTQSWDQRLSIPHGSPQSPTRTENKG